MAAKCFSTFIVEEHLAATRGSSCPNAKKHLMAIRRFLVHFRENVLWLLGNS
jgi:hypothetical protein